MPRLETPPTYNVARPRYLGLTPRGLAIGLAVAATAAGVISFAVGSTAAGTTLLLVAACVAAVVFRQARLATDRTRDAARFTGASVAAWTRAGTQAARFRLEQKRLAHERSRLQYELGAAAFDGNEASVHELRRRLQEYDAAIGACLADARGAVDGARAETADERHAIARTEIRKPGDSQTGS
jgi:hypothetical protein